MATIVRIPFLRTAKVPGHTVYWRKNWSDSWQPDADVFCARATWSANPRLPTATLTCRYGKAVRSNGIAAEISRRQGRSRYFVKIDFGTFSLFDNSQPAPLKWYGTLEVDGDAVNGPLGDVANGRQHFECYGLGFLLDRVIVNSSAVAAGDSGADEFRVDRGLEFDFDGKRNRTKDVGQRGAYLFSGKLKEEDRDWWSTKSAVEYLLAYHPPTKANGDTSIPFDLLDTDGALPDWDHVTLPTQGQSVWELLNSLMSRQRLLGFKLEPNDQETRIQLKPFTFATDDIVLPEISDGTIKANPAQIILACERAADAELVIARNTVDVYDRVIVHGARRTSTFTVSFTDSNIDIGWSNDLENEYEAAASTAGDYPEEAEVEERQWRNSEARKSEKFKSVFAFFKLPTDWDYMAGDGVGGEKSPVFPRDDDPTKNVNVYGPELFVLPRLRLLDGIDYSGANLQDGDIIELVPGPHERLHPVVLFPRHDAVSQEDNKWRTAEDIGLVADLETFGLEEFSTWSARVEVPENSRGVIVRVTNDEQYVIAFTDFTPLEEDEKFGKGDYYNAIFTVCVEWDQFARGVWPEDAEGDADPIRTLTLNLGDGYRCDYVVPGTVYSVSPQSGNALRSTSGGFVRDDRKILNAIARMTFEWYATLRRSVSFSCSRPNGDLFIGQLVKSVGDPAIEGSVHHDAANSVITQITIDCPYIEAETNATLGPVKISYETAFGELDQVKFVSTYAVK